MSDAEDFLAQIVGDTEIPTTSKPSDILELSDIGISIDYDFNNFDLDLDQIINGGVVVLKVGNMPDARTLNPLERQLALEKAKTVFNLSKQSFIELQLYFHKLGIEDLMTIGFDAMAEYAESIEEFILNMDDIDDEDFRQMPISDYIPTLNSAKALVNSFLIRLYEMPDDK